MKTRGVDGKWQRESGEEQVGLSPCPRMGIERELKVIRVGPNPRMVVCEYWEVLERRTCAVVVGDNRKWFRGMVFRMAEPVSEEEYKRPWVYRGRAPRRKGRW